MLEPVADFFKVSGEETGQLDASVLNIVTETSSALYLNVTDVAQLDIRCNQAVQAHLSGKLYTLRHTPLDQTLIAKYKDYLHHLKIYDLPYFFSCLKHSNVNELPQLKRCIIDKRFEDGALFTRLIKKVLPNITILKVKNFFNTNNLPSLCNLTHFAIQDYTLEIKYLPIICNELKNLEVLEIHFFEEREALAGDWNFPENLLVFNTNSSELKSMLVQLREHQKFEKIGINIYNSDTDREELNKLWNLPWFKPAVGIAMNASCMPAILPLLQYFKSVHKKLKYFSVSGTYVNRSDPHYYYKNIAKLAQKSRLLEEIHIHNCNFYGELMNQHLEKRDGKLIKIYGPDRTENDPDYYADQSPAVRDRKTFELMECVSKECCATHFPYHVVLDFRVDGSKKLQETPPMD